MRTAGTITALAIVLAAALAAAPAHAQFMLTLGTVTYEGASGSTESAFGAGIGASLDRDLTENLRLAGLLGFAVYSLDAPEQRYLKPFETPDQKTINDLFLEGDLRLRTGNDFYLLGGLGLHYRSYDTSDLLAGEDAWADELNGLAPAVKAGIGMEFSPSVAADLALVWMPGTPQGRITLHVHPGRYYY